MNYLIVTQNVTVSSGNSKESFIVDQQVSPYSIYADILLNGGFAVDSGNPAPEDDPEDIFFSELPNTVQAVYYGDDPNKLRPKAKFVVWIGDLQVTPVNAFTTDAIVG